MLTAQVVRASETKFVLTWVLCAEFFGVGYLELSGAFAIGGRLCQRNQKSQSASSGRLRPVGRSSYSLRQSSNVFCTSARLRSQFDALAVEFCPDGIVGPARLTEKPSLPAACPTEIPPCPHRALRALPAPYPNIATARCSERCVYTV